MPQSKLNDRLLPFFTQDRWGGGREGGGGEGDRHTCCWQTLTDSCLTFNFDNLLLPMVSKCLLSKSVDSINLFTTTEKTVIWYQLEFGSFLLTFWLEHSVITSADNFWMFQSKHQQTLPISSWYQIVSQGRPTSAREGSVWWTAYTSCVPPHCAVQSHCSILSHDTLHHHLSSNSSLENS